MFGCACGLVLGVWTSSTYGTVASNSSEACCQIPEVNLRWAILKRLRYEAYLINSTELLPVRRRSHQTRPTQACHQLSARRLSLLAALQRTHSTIRRADDAEGLVS